MRLSEVGSSNWTRIAIVAALGSVILLGMVGAIGAHGSATPQYSAFSVGTIASTQGASSLTYTFSASATGGSGCTCSYTWNYGDGTNTTTGSAKSESFTTHHSFPGSGDYTVVLTVVDSVGVQASKNVAVDIASGNSGNGSAGSGTNYLWLYIIIIVAVVVVVALLIYRRSKQNQAPPEGSDQMAYGAAAGGAAYGASSPYSYDYANNPMYQQPPAEAVPPSQPSPVPESSPPPADSSSMPPVESSAPMDAGVGAAAGAAAAPTAPPEPAGSGGAEHANCVVCGGPLTAGYCAQCNMDWNKGSTASSS